MLRLNRLSPARAINVRCTSPGRANPLFLDRTRLLDPAHPAAKLTLRSLPAFTCPQFTIRAFPNAVLHEPVDFVSVNPLLATGLVRARAHTRQRHRWWSHLETATTTIPCGEEADAIRHHKFVAARHLADAYVAALAKRGRHNVNLLFHTTKKATSKSSVVRRRLRSKMTAAIDLVVGRNADATPAPESDQPRKPTPYPPLDLVARPLRENESFVLKDWTYLVVPNLSIYKTPLPNLVQAVRKALLNLGQHAKRLEASWTAPQKRIPPSSRPSSTHSAHKIVGESQSAIETRTHERALGSDTPRVPARHQSIRARLYSRRPVLPHDKPKD